ncbi:MAG: AGE family epimerase/isomerase [Pseudobdellovibrionaceae bacterium]
MLFSTWIPAWATRFADRVHGGFHERLDGNGVPLTGIPRRLVTQCRQIYVYAHADLTTGRRDYADLTANAFEYLLTHYRVPETGGFRFSVMADGTEVDGSYDLYGHAFLVFACTYYYRVSEDPRALEAARGALQLINTKFRMAGKPGFAEALDAQLNPIPRMRRQDPHMHLFEACLFMYRITNEEPYLAMAKEIVDLFTDYFWDAKSKTLPEFYDDDLKPHPEKGEISQPGHHFQWIWLFEKFQETRRKKNPYYYQLMEELFAWADRHGFDPAYGGIYDALDMNGDIISDTKRIWPIMEALKAYPVINRMHDDPHYCTRRASDLVTLLQAHYLREDGTWTEHLSRDMKPLVTDMPGTTPYHIYLGIAALSEIE